MTAKPYDPTLKMLVEIEPESWPILLGPGGATVSRSNVHERIFDVSGHTGRRAIGRDP
jgi:hypothetical protein